VVDRGYDVDVRDRDRQVRRPRRGRRLGIALLVLLLVLAGALVAADRIGANAAENAIADQVSKEMQARGMTSAGKPGVSVGGFPFLTQVARGVYEKITIAIDQPQTQQVKLERLTLVATDVRAAASDLINGRGDVVADKLTGTTTLSWDTVKTLIVLAGLPEEIDPKALQVSVKDNQVQLSLPMVVAGASLTLRASGTLSVADGRVQLRLTDVTVDGVNSTFVRTLVNELRDKLTATIRVPQMPYRLVISNVETGPSGVLVTAVADDVKLAA
jgi:hypothetical protein